MSSSLPSRSMCLTATLWPVRLSRARYTTPKEPPERYVLGVMCAMVRCVDENHTAQLLQHVIIVRRHLASLVCRLHFVPSSDASVFFLFLLASFNASKISIFPANRHTIDRSRFAQGSMKVLWREAEDVQRRPVLCLNSDSPSSASTVGQCPVAAQVWARARAGDLFVYRCCRLATGPLYRPPGCHCAWLRALECLRFILILHPIPCA